MNLRFVPDLWREFTWSDMLAEVLAFAAALDGMGFAPGDGLLVIGDNRPHLYFGMLGAAALCTWAFRLVRQNRLSP